MYEINTLDCVDVEWNDEKHEINIAKHNITFKVAFDALRHPHLEMRSDRNGEIRTLAICKETNRVIAVVFQMRNDICRIISARAARKNEKREFYSVFGRTDH